MGDEKLSKTSGGSVRSSKKRETEVLDAAARVFARRGYHGTSTQDIADELSIQQGSLYYYFRSKEEALELVCARGAEGFVDRANRILESKISNRDKLTKLIAAHCMPLRDSADYMMTFLNERKWLAGEARGRVRAVSQKLELAFETVLRDGRRSGEFRAEIDPRLLTLALLGMVNSVPLWYRSNAATLEDIQDAISSLACIGVLSS